MSARLMSTEPAVTVGVKVAAVWLMRPMEIGAAPGVTVGLNRMAA
jgi:hypothetical protein